MTLGLFLDTSSKNPLMVLISKSRILDVYVLNSAKSSSSYIKSVKEFLEKNNVAFNNLSYLCVGTGPGSFIGTRVAVILGKTFSYALKIPLLHFSSLMCYKIDEDGPFAVIADAKSKGFYALFGTKNKGIVEFENAPSLICDNKIFELFDTRNVYNVELESLYQKKIKPERINTTTFDVELIASLCNKNFIEYSLNPSNLTSAEIFYLRLS